MPAQPAFEAYAIDLINLYRHSFHQGVLEGERNLTAEQDKCRIKSCMMFEPRLGQRQYNKDPTIKARLTYKFTSVPGLVAASCCTFLDLDQLDNNELNVWFHFGIHIQQAPSPNQLVLSVVLRRALKDILSSEDRKCPSNLRKIKTFWMLHQVGLCISMLKLHRLV